MTSGDQKIGKIQTHFKALSETASALNTASDELTKTIAILDEALRKLNIGLTVWVPFRFRLDDNDTSGAYDQDEIGYAKVEGNWGLALRRIYGNEASDDHIQIGPSLFKDTPRELRLLAVDKIPEVIEALSKEASETAMRVQEKTKEVRELASVIEKIASQPNSTDRDKRAGKRTAAGLTSEQLTAIIVGVQHQQKFVGELLESTSRWVRVGSNLQIYFPDAKRTFAELLEGRESLLKISGVAKEVLGYPVQVVVKLEPPAIDVSKAGGDKGGK
jgi:hypothetical protein